jgi:SsrA-binding protein
MKLLAKNKRAIFDYEVSEKLVAGLVLTGSEVKSVKAGHASLKGSYVTIQNGEAFLLNAHINPYPMAGSTGHQDPLRSRKLLMHKKEIDKLVGHKADGLTAIPLALLQDRGLVKVEVGIARGKKLHDKRQSIKERDLDREARRLSK